jgi:hypothetical protein
MSDLEDFLAVLRPDRQRYVITRPGRKPYEAKSYLSESLIEAHYRGDLMVAFFASGPGRDYVAIDVDDHRRTGGTGGWNGATPTERLVEKIEEVVHRMRVEPSVIFRSPEGAHLYWLLDRQLPNEVLALAMNPVVADLIGEYRATPKDALRIPLPWSAVNLLYEHEEFAGFRNLPRRSAEAIFGERISPKNIKAAKVKDSASSAGKKPRVGPDRVKNLEQAEAAAGLFQNGETNPLYRQLVGTYYANGLTQDEAIKRFEALLTRSVGYTGRLREELERRVRSSYKNLARLESTSGATVTWRRLRREPKALVVVASILEASGLPPESQARAGLEKIIWGLWTRKLQNDCIANDPAQLAAHEYRHPGFRRLYAQGYYPVSSKDLHRWNARYTRYLNILVSLGVLAESPFGYSSHGRCKHYAMNINKFEVLRGNSLRLKGGLAIEPQPLRDIL